MIYMTAEQAAELDILELDTPARITIVSKAKMAEITAAAFKS